MVNYKPVKILFDLDDPHHLKLYNYLKSSTNGSSFIRSLLHQDMNGYKVVKEQDLIESEQPVTDVVTESTTASVYKAAHDSVRINDYSSDDDISVEDLI
jgi:hypothetical protein